MFICEDAEPSEFTAVAETVNSEFGAIFIKALYLPMPPDESSLLNVTFGSGFPVTTASTIKVFWLPSDSKGPLRTSCMAGAFNSPSISAGSFYGSASVIPEVPCSLKKAL